ncbi:MAG: murein L,D-transpeptidase family protein [Ferruginibacter sp.]
MRIQHANKASLSNLLFVIGGCSLLFLCMAFGVHQSSVLKKRIASGTLQPAYRIIIDKSDMELKVFDSIGWFATYPVVFGSKDLGDKLFEGDKRTPNGSYKIILKTVSKKWGPQLLLDYPNASNYSLFDQRKAAGVIPKKAKIGNGIAIHGTRPAEEWAVDYNYNWTDGCISLKYTEMQDLYQYIDVGTDVVIQP